MFDAKKIKKLGFSNTAIFSSVDSTNDFLSEMTTSGKESIIAVSQMQTKGRGRFAREWVSLKGGLYFSFTEKHENIVYPLQLFPIACAIGVYRYLESLRIPLLRYKWPNDILVKNRKISGILCEFSESVIIAGIGVNINTEAFPEEISDFAVSVYSIKRREYSLTDALVEIVNNIRNVKNSAEITKFMNESGMIGKRIMFSSNGRIIEGTVDSFKENGEIVINSNSILESFIAGDATFVRERE
ncbi:MAG: biotin--[acetyl-CoA-carboxylase] ligase [bacterium]|nr:biotin--[acetyl-CoA-carboxylase] ligase [bacterium]